MTWSDDLPSSAFSDTSESALSAALKMWASSMMLLVSGGNFGAAMTGEITNGHTNTVSTIASHGIRDVLGHDGARHGRDAGNPQPYSCNP